MPDMRSAAVLVFGAAVAVVPYAMSVNRDWNSAPPLVPTSTSGVPGDACTNRSFALPASTVASSTYARRTSGVDEPIATFPSAAIVMFAPAGASGSDVKSASPPSGVLQSADPGATSRTSYCAGARSRYLVTLP